MIEVFQSKSELANYFCEELYKLSISKAKIFIAFSGGSTPKIIFEVLASNYKEKINWDKLHLFWSDERCVPPDDDESNFGMTKKCLLNFIDIPQKNVHHINGKNDPEKEAISYSEEIKKIVPFKNKYPLFDLVMLGIGEDGHTASIFPDQMHLLDSDKICDVAIHPSTGQKRITMTGKVINNSDAIRFLVTGESKADILKKIIEEKKEIYPAEFINPLNGNLNYYVDEEASSLLDKRMISLI
ncbi:MAG: 6-phosphogluconolactonase [Ignavibacteriaceae bacterium]|nr:6-phosphogluconolactonase [Ignavibacteriaceae bacterium]